MKQRAPQSGNEWFHRAVRYLARFDRTAAQVERFLLHKGAAPVHVKRVMSRLSALRYLDDRAYAVRWLKATLSRRPMGRDRLKSELVARGVGERLVDEAIVEGLEGIDEDQLARRALTLKSRGGLRPSRQRMLLLLRQRGFAEETIERIISGCLEKERPT